MRVSQGINNEHRLEKLRAILNHERNLVLERVRELRRDQAQEAIPPPADEMDAARSLADIETHASLIERAEERLKAIDFAFNRLEQGRYGICAQCGDEISLARLGALPFAAYCVECQEKHNHEGRAGKPWMDEPFVHQWDLPEEMEETTETSRDEAVSLAPEEIAIPAERPRRPETKSAKKPAKPGRAKPRKRK